MIVEARNPVREQETVCIFAGQVALYLPSCSACVDFLETCTPIVGRDGYIHGECGVAVLCEDCNVSGCCFYTPYYERR